MAKVLIVYASDHGTTEKMARVVAQGVESVAGAEAVLKKAGEATAEDILAAGALILGSPVHMGSMHWELKKFIDEQTSSLWLDKRVKGRVGAVFATGSGYGNGGAGVELAMLAMLADLAEMGYLIVPLPNNVPGYARGGHHWGAYARGQNEDLSPIAGGLPEERTEAAFHHGANVARVVLAIDGAAVFNP